MVYNMIDFIGKTVFCFLFQWNVQAARIRAEMDLSVTDEKSVTIASARAFKSSESRADNTVCVSSRVTFVKP